LSTYTQWYWKIDLHNFLHFLSLRVDRHAQWEIQQYGRVMAGMLKKVAPLSYEAWIDYDLCGARLSRMEMQALRSLLQIGEDDIKTEGKGLDRTAMDALGLTKREINEFLSAMRASEVPDFNLDPASAVPADTFAQRFAAAVPKGEHDPSDG
jgi:thymidylate synthase (FAD)